MSTEDEPAHLRRLNRRLIELLASHGINWIAELASVIGTEIDQAANCATCHLKLQHLHSFPKK